MINLALTTYIGTFLFIFFSRYVSAPRKKACNILATSFFTIAFIFLSITVIQRSFSINYLTVTGYLDMTLFVCLGITFYALMATAYKYSQIILFIPSVVIAIILSCIIFLEIEAPPRELLPILKNNFWLVTHVSSVLLGYSAILLAMLYSHYVIWKDQASQNEYSFIIATLLQVGAFLLGIGIALGAFWAEVAWGTFWSWDPKEAWALITFTSVLVLMLAYQQSLISNKIFAYSIIGIAVLILITWTGLNGLYRIGRHSYGFTPTSSNIFLVIKGYLLFETIFIITSLVHNKKKKRT